MHTVVTYVTTVCRAGSHLPRHPYVPPELRVLPRRPNLLEPRPQEQRNAGRRGIAPDRSATVTLRVCQCCGENGGADSAAAPRPSGHQTPDPPGALRSREQPDAPDHDAIRVPGGEGGHVWLVVTGHPRRRWWRAAMKDQRSERIGLSGRHAGDGEGDR